MERSAIFRSEKGCGVCWLSSHAVSDCRIMHVRGSGMSWWSLRELRRRWGSLLRSANLWGNGVAGLAHLVGPDSAFDLLVRLCMKTPIDELLQHMTAEWCSAEYLKGCLKRTIADQCSGAVSAARPCYTQGSLKAELSFNNIVGI